MRLATANMYNQAVENITAKQVDITRQQGKVSSGQRVERASDDPISAARAERALNRITQLQAEQRALDAQRDSLTVAESTLGSAGGLLQRFRELLVQAGNATNTGSDRTTLANEMRSIREQLLALANTKDANGNALFGGLEIAKVQGVASEAFTTTGAEPNLVYQFNGTPGQNSPTQSAVPYTMDGNAIFMQVPKGNGYYDVTLGAANTGQISTDIGQFSTTPAGGAITTSYQISFAMTGTPAVATYTVDTVPPTVPLGTGTFVSGQPISFTDTAPAPDVNIALTVYGTPAAGDTVAIAPYTLGNPATDSLFGLLDDAINGITGASSKAPALAQAVAQGLTHVDSSLDKIQAARGQAGQWLNRADTVTGLNETVAGQLESDRSNAQDLDMAAGISNLQQLTTGYQAALQSYAKIQGLSLFDYIR